MPFGRLASMLASLDPSLEDGRFEDATQTSIDALAG